MKRKENKMRKALLAILILVSILLVGCGGGQTPTESSNGLGNSAFSSEGETSSDGNETTYTISYQWNDYGTVYDGIENFPKEMTAGLEFPTEYEAGETVAVPKLNMWKKNSKLVYEFQGWYYDADLKNEVSGEKIPATATGDITLYAKVVAYVN
jgi:hypothetical protein